MTEDNTGITTELLDVSRRRSLVADLRRIWSRRHFLWYSAVSELRAEQIDTVLGNLWHVLNPSLQVLIYFLVFGQILGVDRGVDNFLPFVGIGIFSFTFMRRVVIQGSKSLISNQGLIQSISFPLATLPMSVLASELVAYASPLTVMLAVAVVTGEPITLSWLLVLPIVGLMALFSLGLAFVAARITFHVRDFQNILDFLFRMAFYFSGVIFLVDRFVADPGLRRIAKLNPFLDLLYLQRWAVMGMEIEPYVAVAAVLWSIASVLFGYLYFRAREKDYGRD